MLEIGADGCPHDPPLKIYLYDVKGRLESVTDTLGRATAFTYDAADRETVVTLPGSRSVHLGYDSNGNLTRITPLAGTASHFLGYDDIDLSVSYTRPGVSGVSNPATGYEYNDDRQLTRVVRPDTVVTLSYNGSTGKLTEIHHPQGVHAFTYTASPSTGQIKTATSADSVIVTYDYDGALLKKETWTGRVSGSVERTFNRWFRDSTEQVNGGSTVTFRYDGDGLLVGAGTLCIQRRGDDGLIEGTTAGVVTSELGYNGLGELTDLHYKLSGSTYFRQQLYRDGLGRIIRIGETVDGVSHSRVYRYDAAGRLDSVAVDSTQVAAYRYDGNSPGNGNRTLTTGPTSTDTVSATYDAQDRMTRQGAVGYSYTGNGELKKIQRSGSDSTLVTYDALGDLVRVKLPGHQLDYLSDGEARRVGYKLDGVLQRVWLYRNGLNPVAELDRNGSVVTRYVYGTHAHVPDLLYKGGHGYRMVTDYLGSVRAVVDTGDGTVAQRIDYDAWGVRTTDTAPAFQALGYAGGLTDSATALVRFGARDYEPGMGRWTSKDRLVGIAAIEGLYNYVSNSPVGHVDHSGLLTDELTGIRAQLRCADARARDFYGPWLTISDATSVLSIPSVLMTLTQEGVVSITDLLAIDAMWAARLRGAATGLSFGARTRLAEQGASEAARLAGLRATLTWATQATGVASAFATGFSIGARIAFLGDCDCRKSGSE